jgi:hypothetical protein
MAKDIAVLEDVSGMVADAVFDAGLRAGARV